MSANKIDPAYPMKKDEEVKRLTNQHDVIKDAMGTLLFANVDLNSGPLRILDSGTADGTWLRDLAESAPTQHELFGTDIDPSNFPADAGNITYQAQDINKAWPEAWNNSFDLVHQRLVLVSGGSSQKEALSRLIDLVKPGGWIQLIEATNVLPEASNGDVMRAFVGVMNDVFKIMGANLNLAEDLPAWLKEAGLTDVNSRLIDLNLGKANANPGLGEQGAYSTSTAAGGLATFAKTLPAGAISQPPENLDTLGPDLKAELTEHGGVYPVKVVWGRKPS